MIKLINGRGQLGTELARIITNDISELIFIYHTWNVDDKSEEAQKACYLKFKDFVDANPNPKIIFISTYSQTDNPYNYYKHTSESYLLSHNEKGQVIRLPTLIGKGICNKFRNKEAEPFGEMNLISVEDAAQEIMNFILSNSKVRSITIKGNIISAKSVKRLIEFGRDGK